MRVTNNGPGNLLGAYVALCQCQLADHGVRSLQLNVNVTVDLRCPVFKPPLHTNTLIFLQLCEKSLDGTTKEGEFPTELGINLALSSGVAAHGNLVSKGFVEVARLSSKTYNIGEVEDIVLFAADLGCVAHVVDTRSAAGAAHLCRKRIGAKK